MAGPHPLYTFALFTQLTDVAMHATDATNERLTQANAAKTYTVTRAELPLSCPSPQMKLWNSHPRVYLPIEATGEARCPYCGALYTLVAAH
jgi:uncharacterized Zn-finger protein